MSEDEEWAKENEDIKDHVQPLGRKVKGSTVDALGSRVVGGVLGLPRDAADHLHDQDSKISSR